MNYKSNAGLIIEKENTFENNEEKILDKLDQEQYEAVTCNIEGNLLCNSIAGSGKTNVITKRVAWLILKGIDPENIMLLTFTNKAADEMTKRVSDIFNGAYIGITSGTFHSIASRYLRRYAATVGYGPNFTILDSNDATKLITQIRSKILEERNIPKKEFASASSIYDAYSQLINLKQSIDDCKKINEKDVEIVRHILSIYQRSKVEFNLMDFDDLLVNFNKVLDVEINRAKIQKEISHVLIDEYQDINYLQEGIIDKISNKENVFAVGDPSQSIYGFRGSDINYILDFPEKYNAKEINLQNNYRSDKNILALAEKSINKNKQKFFIRMNPFKRSNFPQRYSEYNDIYSEIDNIMMRIDEMIMRDVPLSEIAILLRSSFGTTVLLEKEFRSRGIPYDLRAGYSYFERTHIKDMVSILTLLVNPKCLISFNRALGLLNGLGKKTIDKVHQYFQEISYDLEILEKNIDKIKISKRACASLKEFLSIINAANKKENVNDIIDYITRHFYIDYFKSKSSEDDPEVDEKITDILALSQISDAVTLLDFLEEITLDGDDIEDNEKDDEKIVISTMHRAKGLEWDYVFIPFMNMGYFPKKVDDEIEGERRLFYVALTRARKQLFLSYNRNSYMLGADYKESLFLTEISK